MYSAPAGDSVGAQGPGPPPENLIPGRRPGGRRRNGDGSHLRGAPAGRRIFFPPLWLMAPAVAEQAHWFLWAMGLGAGLALVYDCLRELHGCFPGHHPADLAFLALAVFVLAYLGLALCHGRLRLFQLLGRYWGWRIWSGSFCMVPAGLPLLLADRRPDLPAASMASPNSVEKNQKILKFLFQLGANGLQYSVIDAVKSARRPLWRETT